MKFERFLTKNEIKRKAISEWQPATWAREDNNKKPYGNHNAFERIDNGKTEYGPDSISELHGISFIKEVIPELIAQRKGGRVRILDVGTGAAFFPDQIRKEFGDKVEVYSTGLSKKTARDYREDNKPKGEQKLHRNDLKWRSVLELSDFEEFDLILDTYGEMIYLKRPHSEPSTTTDDINDYLTVLIRKLRPGGLISISPVNVSKEAQVILNELGTRYGAKFEFPQEEPWAMRITK